MLWPHTAVGLAAGEHRAAGEQRDGGEQRLCDLRRPHLRRGRRVPSASRS
jgi:hypothetical protein